MKYPEVVNHNKEKNYFKVIFSKKVGDFEGSITGKLAINTKKKLLGKHF